uniref:Uncharacterized protein n=1 Tax=Lactuca sativa TaxID=4236 RepID=A0A9R1WH72_LACSA|nr:hypothetical protein LSAT_V11C200060040 [Lactuca sativa]
MMSHIQNVEGDGHYGFWAIIVALGFSEDYWYQIWKHFYGELLMHIHDYIVVFENDKKTISEAFIFYKTPAIRKYWMIIPDTCILIANKYNESSTSFPLWSGSQDFQNHPIINIAFLNSCHYIKVDLQEGHPIATVSWLWNIQKSTRCARWQTLYHPRLSAYV